MYVYVKLMGLRGFVKFYTNNKKINTPCIQPLPLTTTTKHYNGNNNKNIQQQQQKYVKNIKIIFNIRLAIVVIVVRGE